MNHYVIQHHSKYQTTTCLMFDNAEFLPQVFNGFDLSRGRLYHEDCHRGNPIRVAVGAGVATHLDSILSKTGGSDGDVKSKIGSKREAITSQ